MNIPNLKTMREYLAHEKGKNHADLTKRNRGVASYCLAVMSACVDAASAEPGPERMEFLGKAFSAHWGMCGLARDGWKGYKGASLALAEAAEKGAVPVPDVFKIDSTYPVGHADYSPEPRAVKTKMTPELVAEVRKLIMEAPIGQLVRSAKNCSTQGSLELLRFGLSIRCPDHSLEDLQFAMNIAASPETYRPAATPAPTSSTPPKTSSHFSPSPLTAGDPKAIAAAEWKANKDGCNSTFIDEKTYASVRVRELTGRATWRN